MLKYLQNRCLRPKYRFYTSFYIYFFFFGCFFVSGIILDHSIHIFWFFLIKKKSKTRRGVRAGRSAFLIFFPAVLHVEKIKKNKSKKNQKSISDLLLRRPTFRRPTFKETCVSDHESS